MQEVCTLLCSYPCRVCIHSVSLGSRKGDVMCVLAIVYSSFDFGFWFEALRLFVSLQHVSSGAASGARLVDADGGIDGKIMHASTRRRRTSYPQNPKKGAQGIHIAAKDRGCRA